MGDVVPNEFPDISTEGGASVLLIQCVDVRMVLIVPDLHWVIGTSSVGLPVVGVSPGHSGFLSTIICLLLHFLSRSVLMTPRRRWRSRQATPGRRRPLN